MRMLVEGTPKDLMLENSSSCWERVASAFMTGGVLDAMDHLRKREGRSDGLKYVDFQSIFRGTIPRGVRPTI